MIKKATAYLSGATLEEVDKAVSDLSHQSPLAGLFALVAEADKEIVPVIQHACRNRNTPLAGAIFPELIVSGDFVRNGVLLVCLNPMPPMLLATDLSSPSSIQAVEKELLSMLDDSSRSLFVVFDGMVPNVSTLLDQLYLSLADRVTYGGVNAGSETFSPMPCLFDNDQLIQGGALFLLPNTGDQHTTLSHGYRMPENVTIATAAEGNRITSIDWQPAIEAYSRLAKEQYGVEITKLNFYEVGVHFPLGIVLGSGELLVRIPVGVDDDGAVFCVGEVPPNSLLTLLNGTPDEIVDAVDKVADHVNAESDNGLFFYCAGRRMHLGAEVAELEMKRVGQDKKDINGALSLGEIGSTQQGQYPRFHNAALVYCPYRS